MAALSLPDQVKMPRTHDLPQKSGCVLLAEAHLGLSEGTRGLLATVFAAVVMVADEVSLFESASRLHSDVAVIDLALPGRNGLELIRRFRRDFPAIKVIVISVHDELSVSRSVLEAGAHAFIIKRSIATDLLDAVDSVLSDLPYVSPELAKNAHQFPG
ncbi:MAG: response regulator transcription factor [Xanthobacteraceae bacterium]